MRSIEPGEVFTVKYGNEHEVEVVSLSMRQKRRMVELIEQVSSLSETGESRVKLFDIAEQALQICVPGLSDEFLDTINEDMAMEIITGTMAGQMITADDKKKSELPPSSAAVNSASDAAAVA